MDQKNHSLAKQQGSGFGWKVYLFETWLSLWESCQRKLTERALQTLSAPAGHLSQGERQVGLLTTMYAFLQISLQIPDYVLCHPVDILHGGKAGDLVFVVTAVGDAF